VERAEVAGPGFINFFLKDAWYEQVLRAVLDAGEDYGRTDAGGGRRVLVEFVSANPTGPLNVVSARHATVGDVLCNVMAAAGYRVDREYYVNDAGNQTRMLGAAMDVRIRQLEGEDAQLPEGAYLGEYLIPVAKAFLEQHGTAGRPDRRPPWEPLNGARGAAGHARPPGTRGRRAPKRRAPQAPTRAMPPTARRSPTSPGAGAATLSTKRGCGRWPPSPCSTLSRISGRRCAGTGWSSTAGSTNPRC